MISKDSRVRDAWEEGVVLSRPCSTMAYGKCRDSGPNLTSTEQKVRGRVRFTWDDKSWTYPYSRVVPAELGSRQLGLSERTRSWSIVGPGRSDLLRIREGYLGWPSS